MVSNKVVDPRVRLVIAQWSADAPRGAVTTFCIEHGISRAIFYRLRQRAEAEGQAAALEPRSRRPASSPTRVRDGVKDQALRVRTALEASGLDYGPISVHDKMLILGMRPPSIATLARVFREAGVARAEPNKRPRAAFHRFVYPAPNACWQLDATEYVLARGRKCVIFQLLDDHSRLSVASHVAWGETAEGALSVVRKGIAVYGVPQRLLSDNGVALNPERRGYQGQLVRFLRSLGVTPITGKPGHPMTQGKNERVHQTLFKFLSKQPLVETLEQLQGQVDLFDEIYNDERPHQGLPGRVTPRVAWEATEIAEPPRPTPFLVPVTGPAASLKRSEHTVDGIRTTRVRSDGTVRVSKVEYRLGVRFARVMIFVVATEEVVDFFDDRGTMIATADRALPGVSYVGTKMLRWA